MKNTKGFTFSLNELLDKAAVTESRIENYETRLENTGLSRPEREIMQREVDRFTKVKDDIAMKVKNGQYES